MHHHRRPKPIQLIAQPILEPLPSDRPCIATAAQPQREARFTVMPYNQHNWDTYIPAFKQHRIILCIESYLAHYHTTPASHLYHRCTTHCQFRAIFDDNPAYFAFACTQSGHIHLCGDLCCDYHEDRSTGWLKCQWTNRKVGQELGDEKPKYRDPDVMTWGKKSQRGPDTYGETTDADRAWRAAQERKKKFVYDSEEIETALRHMSFEYREADELAVRTRKAFIALCGRNKERSTMPSLLFAAGFFRLLATGRTIIGGMPLIETSTTPDFTEKQKTALLNFRQEEYSPHYASEFERIVKAYEVANRTYLMSGTRRL